MTNEDIILSLLRRGKSLCDDCISTVTSITPRQQVNQICRRLSESGQIRRQHQLCNRCGKGKLVNTSEGKPSQLNTR